MPVVTFTDAARSLGFKSRSALYRLRDDGLLADYLRPPASPGGAQLLELEPRGLPPLREHIARLIQPRITNAHRTTRPRLDPRWELVAESLTEAMADCGGLQLCGTEAQVIAGALPQAMGAVFGMTGLELLRVVLADAGYGWRVGSGTRRQPDDVREWWSEWGRFEPEEELEDRQFWENVGGIAGGMMGPPFHGMSGGTAVELFHQLHDAIDDVGRGARWDAAIWDTMSARSLLEDPEVQAGSCDATRPEVERLAAGGLLPPDLQAQADAALANYRQREQLPAAALSVGAD